MYTSCNSGFYLNGTSAGNSCVSCTGVSFTDSTTDTSGCTETARTATGSINGGGSYNQPQTRTGSRSGTRTCWRTGGAGGTNGSSACTGSANCGAWEYGGCSYGEWVNSGARSITCPAGTYWNGSACASCESGYYCPGFSDVPETSLTNGYGRNNCTNAPANAGYTGSATTNSCAWSCNAGYYGSSANGNTACVDCGKGNYCTGGINRATCASTVPAGVPTPSSIISISSGSWDDYEHATGPSDCICDWYFSDETRTQYLNETTCSNGPGGNNFTKYHWCRTGYYATEPLNFNEWYNSCSACTNGPANSTYTSYSTPSSIYAVESNCPWQCNADYYKNGDVCTACDSGYSSPAGSTTMSACTKSCSRACTQQTCPANATCDHGNTSISGTDRQGIGCDAAESTCSITVTCNPGYYKNSSGTCTACEDGYFCAGNNIRTACTTLGDGYTKSDGTRKADTDCFQSCSKACTQQTCPINADSCTHGSTSTVGTQHYGASCTAAESDCSLTINSCQNGNYKDGNSCETCPASHPNSVSANTGGIGTCYVSCVDIKITNGTDKADRATVYYSDSCTYTRICDSGYNLTSGNVCAQLCTAGVTKLNLATGVAVPLYSAKQTARVIGIGIGGQVCYGSLAAGSATGALNVIYGGTTYHSID